MGVAVMGAWDHAKIHPTAVVDEGAVLGAGTQVWHFSHVMSGSRIGSNCRLGQNVFVGAGVSIGDRVKIQNNVSVYEGVTLEEDVFCGPSAVFTNVKDPRSAFPKDRTQEFGKTLVRRGATIGANATVLCGLTIGAHAFIGAGAVVTRDVPPFALVFGSPARIQGWMCVCGARLALGETSAHTTGGCARCGRRFERRGEQVRETGAAAPSSPARTAGASGVTSLRRHKGARASARGGARP